MRRRTVSLGIGRGIELANHQLARGDRATAERTLERLLRREPASAEAYRLLSVIADADGRFTEAIATAQQAILLAPRQASHHVALGRAFKTAQRLDEALQAYERAVELDPDFADVRVSMGVTLRLLGRLDDAIEQYRSALRLRPDFPEALGNLGNALTERLARQVGERLTAEDLREAEQVQRRALALAPSNPNHLHNLALVLKLTGRTEEAFELLNRALGLAPSRADICQLFAELLYRETRYDLARLLCTRWLSEHTPNATLMRVLALNLIELGDFEEATRWLDRHDTIEPGSVPAQHLRGRITQQRFVNDVDARHALEVFRSAIERRPDYYEAVCSYLLTLCYAEPDPAALLAEHRARVAPVLAANARAVAAGSTDEPAMRRPRANGEQLRIGYLSYDYKRHSVAYFLESLLESHDRSRFEIHAYKTNPGLDAVGQRLRGHFDHWVEAGHMSDVQLADQIRSDGIDVLIDLNGLTSGGRLGVMQRRPAPCQVNFLGYPTSIGSPFHDLRLSDWVIDPGGEEAHSSETLLRLAHGMFCYRPGPAPDVAPLPALARGGAVTFGSFNNLAKAGPATLALWRAVLDAVPHSRLLLKAQALMQHGNREAIRQYFAACGIAPERIVVQPWIPDVQDHLATYGEVDIGLDTTPFNGATTTCEALHMGVPVLSLRGRTHPARMGASILTSAGLPELVADSSEQLVTHAVALASDLPALATLRAGLRERLQCSHLYDRDGYTRNFEALLQQALQQRLGVPALALAEPALA
jgi:predicted O-linked N-acetylglucosamine transferase (SPINDLY family)